MFIKLDAVGITDYDEGKHAAEAYEMFHRDAWIAHTYYWEIDYFNSKPPLYYWLTNIFFKVFGVSMVSFKLPSVIAGALLCGIMALFLYRLQKKRFEGNVLALLAIPLFMASFITSLLNCDLFLQLLPLPTSPDNIDINNRKALMQARVSHHQRLCFPLRCRMLSCHHCF